MFFYFLPCSLVFRVNSISTLVLFLYNNIFHHCWEIPQIFTATLKRKWFCVCVRWKYGLNLTEWLNKKQLGNLHKFINILLFSSLSKVLWVIHPWADGPNSERFTLPWCDSVFVFVQTIVLRLRSPLFSVSARSRGPVSFFKMTCKVDFSCSGFEFSCPLSRLVAIEGYRTQSALLFNP